MALKAFANIAFSFLLVVTLLWGGCLSCPQYFMFPDSHGGCCHPTGKCEQHPGKEDPARPPASSDCNIQPIALAPATPDAAAHPVLAIAIAPAILTSVPANVLASSPIELRPHGPEPDLSLLHSVFRI
jgi:hypothetical protein